MGKKQLKQNTLTGINFYFKALQISMFGTGRKIYFTELSHMT